MSLIKKYNDNSAGSRPVSGSVVPRKTLFDDTNLSQSVSKPNVVIGRTESSLFRKRQETDEKRIEKFINSPAGQNHTVKEVGFARSNPIFNPSTERGFIDNPSRVINPRKVITNTGLAGSGIFNDKFGIVEGARDLGYVKYLKDKEKNVSKLKYLYDKEVSPNLKYNPEPFTPSSFDTFLGKIDAGLSKVNSIFDPIRGFFGVPLPLSKLYEYPGGPGSNNGIGLTTIYRYDKLDNPKYYDAKNTFNTYRERKELPNNYEENKFWWKRSNLTIGNLETNKESSRFVFDGAYADNFISTLTSSFGFKGKTNTPGSGIFFKASGSTETQEYNTGRIKEGISDYYITKPIRLWEGRTISISDKKYIVDYETWVTGSRNSFYEPDSKTSESEEVNPDLIDFKLEIIDLETTDTGNRSYYLYFKAFIDSFTDDFKASYDTIAYPGNPSGKLYKYQSFDRSISLTFKVAIFAKEEFDQVYKKLNRLASTTLPTITDEAVRSTITKLTVGSWCKRLPGVVSGITFQNLVENPWDIDEGAPQILTINLSYLYSSTYDDLSKTFISSSKDIGTTLFGPDA